VRALAGGFSAAPWVAPLGVARLLRRWGARRVTELDWWAATELGPLSVMATPAQHFSARHFFDRNRSLWCGWGLSGNRRAVFFAGDTGYHPAFAEIGQRLAPLDVVLMPVGAYEPRWFMQSVHLNPEEAVRAFEDLTASGPSRPTLVPIHWGTFKLSDEPMDEPPRRVRAAWEARGLPAAELWIPRHGETRAF
jgi:N-acyl-phosphatidylethanolamine-hydrolysing phospholipase D